MKLGKVIKDLRKAKGINQTDLATKVGISQTSLSNIEVDKRMPHYKTLISIAKALEIPLPFILIKAYDIEDTPIQYWDDVNKLKIEVEKSILYYGRDKSIH